MQDGNWVYYVLQCRRTAVSPWLKPDEPLEPVTDEDAQWRFSCWDRFGWACEPWTGSSNDRKPQFPASHDETRAVWAKVGHEGWWTLRFAVLGLQRVRKASADGHFDSRHDGRLHQRVRHEFRLVKMSVTQRTDPVSCEDLIEELAAT